MYVIIFTNPSYAPPHKNENERDLGKLKSHKTSKSQLFIILFLISFHFFFFFSKQIQNTPHCPRRYYRDPDTTDDEAMDEESTNSPLLKIKWRPQERTTVAGGLGESKLNESSSNKLLAGRIASFKSLKHLLLLLVLLVCRLGVVECFAKLPDGDGAQHPSQGTIRYAINDWRNSNKRSDVVALYGPIEDWDVSDVTNMQNAIYDFADFNADISKWNTSQVTNMNSSKCASLLLLSQLILKKIGFDVLLPLFSYYM